MEGIGDRFAAVEPDCRSEAAVDLGDQHPAGGDSGAVELGKRPQSTGVPRGSEPKRHLGDVALSHRHVPPRIELTIKLL